MLKRILAFLPALFLATLARAQCTPSWSPGEGLPGVDGPVNAITSWDPGTSSPVIVIGGQFGTAGHALASNVATWNGSAWSPLGSGLPNTVASLCVYNGELLAGMAPFSGGDPNLRRWNGQTWEALSPNISGHVRTMTVFNGELIVTGQNLSLINSQSLASVLAWNGTSWRILGGYLGSQGFALTVHDGQLIVGGGLISPFSPSIHNVAAWDGSTWQPLGNPLNFVYSLTDYNGTLIAAAGNNALAWDGAAWTAVGSLAIPSIKALSIYRGQLVAAGGLVASWNGTTWTQLTSGSTSPVNALATFNDDLYIGGAFAVAGTTSAPAIAKWDGAAWHALGTGFTTDILSFTPFGTDLIASAAYASPTSPSGNALAAWNGTSWRPYGSGFTGGYIGVPRVYAVASYNGELVAAGKFDTAGGIPASNIAAGNAQTWHALGTGVSPLYYVGALCVYHNELIVGGQFETAGGMTVNNIAAWNGTSWRAIGTGTSGGDSGSPGIHVMIVYNGQLIVGGSFNSIDGIAARNIASWDGTTWSPMNGGLGGTQGYNTVSALAELNSNLYVGGSFSQAGTTQVYNLAKWNAGVWTSSFGYLNGTVLSLATHNNQLIVGGYFSQLGFTSTGVAAHNGSTWLFLGSGLDRPLSTEGGPVEALASYNGTLFAGGGFFKSGAMVNGRVAQWACTCYANCDQSTTPPLLSAADFQCFLNKFTTGDSYANCDGSTRPPALNVNDFQCFLNKFAAGCP